MNSEVRRYFEAAPKDRTGRRLAEGSQARRLLARLRALILELYPDAEVVISYQLPTFKVESGWVALGYWSGGVTLFTNGPQHIAEFKRKHPEIKTGKGSISFKVSDPLPAPALRKVIRHAMEHSRSS